MAARVAVLDPNSSLIDYRLKRAEARRRIAAGVLAWVIEGICARVIAKRAERISRGYVPDKLPMAELPGLKFKPPIRRPPPDSGRVIPPLETISGDSLVIGAPG